MKINLSLHIRYLVEGVILLFSMLLLALGIPSFDESVVGEVFEEISYFDDEVLLFSFLYALFCIMLAYSIGMLSEVAIHPLRKSRQLSKHLSHFGNLFSKDTSWLSHSLTGHDEIGKLSDVEIYKYMSSYINLRDANLYKEVTDALFKVHVVMVLAIVSLLLGVVFGIQLFAYDYGYDDEFVTYLCLSMFCLLCMAGLYGLGRKCRVEVLDAIERGYYLLTRDRRANSDILY